MASKTHVRSAVVTACVNCRRSTSTVDVVFVKCGSDRGGIDRTPLTWFQMLRAVSLATYGRGPSNRWDDVRGPLIADERWGLLQFVNDPRLQSLEYVEVPCGNYHPPVRLNWKEGSLKGVWELQAGAHAQLVGGRRLLPLGCLRFPCLPHVSPNVPKPGLGGA